MTKATQKEKGMFMVQEFHDVVMSGKFLKIQQGRKGQSLKQSMDEVAEDFHNPIVPYIDSFNDAEELIRPVLFQIHGDKKLESAFAKSLYYTLLLMARDKQSGSWVAQISFAYYLSFGDLQKAQTFILFINGKLNESLIISMALMLNATSEYVDLAPLFSDKLKLLKKIGINLNGKFQENSWSKDKTTIAQELAKNLPDDDYRGEVPSYLEMLEAAHLQGIDLVKALPIAEEEGNQEFNSFVMKLKLDKDAKPKPEVSRVAQDGGKI
ncbi:hypothetical protein [Burkholderia cenocepacia]|uniref:Uncharacterized protein n=1 Tax=Burkholderia cenocepacia TaxID=95486 RepID=A0A1V2VV73_9BURK|nr:hypothetical protein [Burkholderia cenocepacia]ONU47726.1 hypothetical protein A8E62_31920 [Burkholderia cenocepacia]ONU51163.1 hypothetical protein A8E67_35490 [Burkholderia cenocepacia]ONU66305.1 hypothetical protein A8E68_07465 [Burkholderia cenocepacia]ONU71092.1 hypothetical protein A8E63_40945 [Burkholderia cenocepacia]ONU76353.1 hypothetical protein A8E72_34130 [Burkholderia cenocepacia]